MNNSRSITPRFLTSLGTLLIVALILTLGGTAAAQCCVGTVTVSPGDDVQAAVNSNPSGTQFIFNPGVYPNLSVVPKDYDQFISSTPLGATLSGATVVNNFTFHKTANLWIGSVTITPTVSVGQCDSEHAGCLHSEDLFFDGVLYRRVNYQADVVSGTWFLNYTTGKVYLFDNPTGHTIEISTTHFAIGAGDITSVVINGFVIEKYASPTDNGAIEGKDYYGVTTIPAFNWLVENNEVRYNHGAGIWIGDQMTVSGNFAHNNGEYGIAGTGNNVTVTNNQISFNNTVGYLFAWGGGTKFIQVVGLTVTYNNSHDNNGPGLWNDVENSGVVVAYNTTSNNKVAGIFHEISYDAQIHDNTITNDGIDTRGTGPWWGAGIMVANSSDVNVYNNTLTDCQNGIMEQNKNRGNGTNGLPYEVQNVRVYNNNITLTKGFAAGLLRNYPINNLMYTSWGNSFGFDTNNDAAPNTYDLSSGVKFIWLLNNVPNSQITEPQWQALGNN
jgi:Right handed beta helix region